MGKINGTSACHGDHMLNNLFKAFVMVIYMIWHITSFFKFVISVYFYHIEYTATNNHPSGTIIILYLNSNH